MGNEALAHRSLLTAHRRFPEEGPVMPKEMVMPVMAESIVEAEILKWLVSEGDEVKEGQMVAEVMTDKVTTEIPAPFSGRLEKILVKEGQVAQVKQAIASFAGEGEAVSALAPAATPAPSDGPYASTPAKPAATLGADDQDPQKSATNSTYGMPTKTVALDFGGVKAGSSAPAAKVAGTNSFGRPLAVPAARAMARENGIDIATVPGSGPNGRVGVDDVRAFVSGGGSSAPVPAVTQTTPVAAPVSSGSGQMGSGMPVSPPVYRTPKGYEALEERIPLRGMRKAISNAMLASHLYTVRTLTVDETDLSELVKLRERMKPMAEKAGVKLTYLPFIFKAVASALKAFPNVNSSLDDAAGEIVRKKYYNIGCAVDTEAGLIVPVIKDVDRKSILEIAREIVALAGKARDGKLAPDEISGSSFSVTNIGSAGSLISFPIINVPDAAIMGVHTLQERPVVRDGQIVARFMMYLSLSFDHRIIDGAEGARFTKHVCRLLENPDLLLLEAI
jgi:2-oxoisovalerate dehydrogenase E2 component (dihydrolipoyl transacylase)